MDEELRALLIEEVAKRASEVRTQPTSAGRDLEVARRAAHALKGAFGLAAEREIADALGRIERRLIGADGAACADLLSLLDRLAGLLSSGAPMPPSTWPTPPDDLRPSPISHEAHSEYVAAIRDRLARIDASMASAESILEVAREVYREVHTIKGAALAVGDEVMAWFCHGLEERLKSLASEDAARAALAEVELHRGVLAEIVDAPEHALSALRLERSRPSRETARVGVGRPSRPPLLTPLPLPPRRPALESPPAGESDLRGLSEDGTVRVSIAVLDALLERAGQLNQLRTPLPAVSERLGHVAGVARSLREEVREALRMIGPPRPWGAPAAAISRLERVAAELSPFSVATESASEQVSALSTRLRVESDAFAASVQSLRTSFASDLFGRASAAALAEARRTSRLVEVVVQGAETHIDRHLLESLVEPMRQLARNAVAHGIEDPEVRVAAGKPAHGTIILSAQQRAGALLLSVTDDGAGVDPQRVRRLAVEKGALTENEALDLDDQATLAILFSPGFSLKEDVDLGAGRGVGLDLTLASVQRLGGMVELSRRSSGDGLTAQIVVPSEDARVRVLWVTAADERFAVPVQQVSAIHRAADVSDATTPLTQLVPFLASEGRKATTRGLVLEIAAIPNSTVLIEVETVGAIEEVSLRGLPSLTRATGPWLAGIVWEDEVLFCLDAAALYTTARRLRQRAG
ncbi:MAG: Hpt domain-containing protein [Polyangiaceae bacterium]